MPLIGPSPTCCCCGCEITTGARVISGLKVFFCALALILYIVGNYYYTALRWTSVVLLAIEIVAHCCVFVGVAQWNWRLIVPAVILTIIDFILCFVNIGLDIYYLTSYYVYWYTISWIVSYAIVIVFDIWFLHVFASCMLYMKHVPRGGNSPPPPPAPYNAYYAGPPPTGYPAYQGQMPPPPAPYDPKEVAPQPPYPAVYPQPQGFPATNITPYPDANAPYAKEYPAYS